MPYQKCNNGLENLEADTDSFFSPESPLKEADKHGGRPYEYREQQRSMAGGVASALAFGHNLCVEAPTGIGKSFAYLVPAIHFALKSDKPIVISTETINLQEQLQEKDIPLLKEILGLDFTACLAKGRQNYICLRRLRLASGDRKEEFLPLASMMTDIERISQWAGNSLDGSRSSINFRVDPQLWSCICCEGGNCAGPKCEHYRNCFYWKARKAWDKANIIIANHALFFTDLGVKSQESVENTLLPPYSAVIIDEAHTLEDNAAQHLGLRISESAMRYFLNRLYNPTTGKGLLVKAGQKALELRKAVTTAQENSFAFFHQIGEILNERQDQTLRLRKPNFVPDLMSHPLGKLDEMLTEYLKEQEEEDFQTELEAQLNRCKLYRQGIYDFLNMELAEHVYWTENRDGIRLFAAPLNVDELLKKMLFDKGFPVILTSATLTVRQSLDYYRGRIGYCGGEEMVLDSPFNYQKQVELYIPRNMPEPNDQEYSQAVNHEIKRFISMTHGKAFVLFTSYHMLRRCAEDLQTFFSVNDITLLVQGESMTRSNMLNEFRKDTDSVIFGTTSFWTGVDVPGEALSNVIISKLPFAVPDYPLIQARSEKIQEKGNNAFMDYSLPEAILKFRQGTGRLIRSKQDKGIIAILDKRIISKRYGQHFIDSIPQCPIQIC
jgi:ATP-dependent DNA helicase DinG